MSKLVIVEFEPKFEDSPNKISNNLKEDLNELYEACGKSLTFQSDESFQVVYKLTKDIEWKHQRFNLELKSKTQYCLVPVTFKDNKFYVLDETLIEMDEDKTFSLDEIIQLDFENVVSVYGTTDEYKKQGERSVLVNTITEELL